MIYILKTRAVSGRLVPLNGEHIEYDTFETAQKDAQVWAVVHDESVFIVDFAFDEVVEEVSA